MPRERKHTNAVEPNFEEEFKSLSKTKEGVQIILDAVFVLSQVIDQCISENDTWFTIGLQRGGGSVQLTLHEGRDMSYSNGRSLTEFLSSVRSL